MARPQFSELLNSRRRQLGLSIAQASRVLKLKEQVLIAFEEGDWDRIPRSGYAQGMLSSYARYLGLNPRDVIDLFQQDLQTYTSGVDRYKESYDTGVTPTARRNPQTATNSIYSSGQDKDLYGSAGPAGSILTGHELGQPNRRGRTVPLASTRNMGYSERYIQNQMNEQQAANQAASQYPQGRPYTGRAPQSTRSNQTRPRPQRSSGRTSSRRADDGYTSDISTRSVPRNAYADDLTYEAARPYEQANSREGRAASRNIASTGRPNVQRRNSDAARADMKRRSPRQQRSGVAGVIEAYFSNRTRTMVTIFGLLALVIILVLVFSVRACSSSTAAEDAKNSVTVSQTASSSDSTTSSSSSDSATSATTDDTTSDSATATDTTTSTTPVTVTVSVASGEVSWLEITNDNTSVVADTISGPWEQTYTVTGEMTIEANDSSAVTVTENGTQVPFEQRPSGVGSITIKGPGTTATDATASDSTDSTSDSTKSADGTSTDSTTSSSSSSSSSTSDTTKSTT